jgi:hypothetical protein
MICPNASLNGWRCALLLWASLGTAICLSVLPTAAASALKIYAECEAGTDFCAGYIAGSVDEHRTARAAIQMLTGQETPIFCIPEAADTPVLMSIVVDFIEQVPNVASEPGNVAVIKSMQWAFPCSEAMD